MSEALLKQAKRALRKEILGKLATLSAAEVQNQSDKVINGLAYKNAQRISIYVSTEGEIRTDEIIRDALKGNKQVFIPWFAKGHPYMHMVELQSVAEFDSLQPTLWGIRQFETINERKSYTEIGPIDLALVPGVAFTICGDRLGHGMAFYDKFFLEHIKFFGRAPLKLALALNEQLLESVPMGDLDVKLDGVVYASSIKSNNC